jgi:hypothetical protein
VATLSAATTWAASCNLLIADPPAYVICEAPAVAAVAAAQAAVDYYNQKAQQAAAAYNEIQSAIDRLQGLMEDCNLADADGRQDDVDRDVSDGSAAYAAAEAVSIPEVDTQPRKDAQTAVALAEQAVEEAQATA